MTLLSVACIALYRSCKAVIIQVSDCFTFFTGNSIESSIIVVVSLFELHQF
jgi:hypothetical protein